MALTKKQRKQIWDKSGGICWYCGSDLPEKGWHADHVEAVIRNDYILKLRKQQIAMDKARFGCVPDEVRPLIADMVRKEKDCIENMVPACAPCNLFKSTFSVEFFRSEISAQIERARKTSVNFRTAERFGLIEAKPKHVQFWFERQGL